MRISCVDIQNFRKLKQCRIDLSEQETVFVGANNSGKTSAMDALIIFLKRVNLSTRDFTLSNWLSLNEIGDKWLTETEFSKLDLSVETWEPYLPTLDLWLNVEKDQIHYVRNLIPFLDWEDGELGVRLRFEPEDVETIYQEFMSAYIKAKKLKGAEGKFPMWPEDMWDFLDKKGNLNKLFKIRTYLLDPKQKDTFQPLPKNSQPLEQDFLKGLIKVDIINAQRGFSDVNSDTSEVNSKNLSTQLRSYYDNHLNPADNPTEKDVEALGAIHTAKVLFDKNLKESFVSALGELEQLNYPGFGNPTINLSSKINTVESLNHDSSVQYNLMGENPNLSLPEKYNGLGYQNLISMIFKLIRFRDDWMQVGKRFKDANDGEVEFEPLHLVLVEEPEAHLHAQVQQVFIREAYKVLRNHPELKNKNFLTQLVISTHSNHIAHEINFTALRYFKRNVPVKGQVNTSVVENLSTTFGKADDTTKFAIRYLKTTHSDLFFADAVILVEGPVERMLIPHFISTHFGRLNSCYISILEIGGSHAHTLLPLLRKLGIITFIITDIDSIDPADNRKKVQPKRAMKYETNNDTIKQLLQKQKLIDDLYKLSSTQKELTDYPIKVGFQTPISIQGKPPLEVLPYTFEDSLVMENKALFEAIPKSTGLLKKMVDASKITKVEDSATAMYESITAKNAKKAEFALELLYFQEPAKLKVPAYINEGLVWIETKLKNNKDGLKV